MPTRPDSTNCIQLSWLISRQNAPDDVAARFFDAIDRLVPEARPVRFGRDDPPSTEVTSDGLAPVIAAWRSSDDWTWLAARPFGFGRTGNLHQLDGPSPHTVVGPDEPAPVGTVRVDVDARFLGADDNADRVKRFVVDVAESSGAFLAVAEVAHDATWRGAELRAKVSNPAVWWGRSFNGLPIGTVWLAWFGPAYTPLVADHLDLAATASGGLWESPGAWSAPERTDRHRLVGRVPDDLLMLTKDLRGDVGRTEIRGGVTVVAAPHIPAVHPPAGS